MITIFIFASLFKGQVRRHNRDSFLIFFNIKVCCVFSLELPHQGNSYEYTQYTIFNMKGKSPQIILNLQLQVFFPRDSRTCSKQPW